MLLDLRSLFAEASACASCPGMGCAPVLSAANGRPRARILVVGEAPGRLGAAKTGVPFSGDVAGQRFERLLSVAGLRRQDAFVTNAVLCLPLGENGRNRPPTMNEVSACSGWLARTIATLDPELVLAMGRVALKSLSLVSPHDLSLADAGRGPQPWNSRKLAVTYHPGARAAVHRPWERQVEDWQQLGRWIRANCGRRGAKLR